MSLRRPKEDFSDSFTYVFSALKGVQAGREYFVAMCPLQLIPKIFVFDGGEVPPELRGQRVLKRSRVPEIARYLAENPNDYSVSSIPAWIDGDGRVEALQRLSA